MRSKLRKHYYDFGRDKLIHYDRVEEKWCYIQKKIIGDALQYFLFKSWRQLKKHQNRNYQSKELNKVEILGISQQD